MNITQLLEYQKVDKELVKIERALRENKYRKMATKLQEEAKEAQARSMQLESRAESLLAEVEKIKQQFSSQQKSLAQAAKKDIENMNEEEISAFSALKDKLSSNMTYLDKNLTRLASAVNGVLADFNKEMKIYTEAREKYNKCKKLYDAEAAELEPKRQEILKELKTLEGGVDKALLEKYLKRRQDNIFPVIVKVNTNCCGGCSYELSAAQITKLKEEGILTCEHCHRIIIS